MCKLLRLKQKQKSTLHCFYNCLIKKLHLGEGSEKSETKYGTMLLKPVTILLALTIIKTVTCFKRTNIKFNKNTGGYQDIVVVISEELSASSCPQILDNVKVCALIIILNQTFCYAANIFYWTHLDSKIFVLLIMKKLPSQNIICMGDIFILDITMQITSHCLYFVWDSSIFLFY